MLVKTSPLHIVLVDLDDSTATDLGRMLSALNHRVTRSSDDIHQADLVFCDRESMSPLTQRTGTPVVAVSPEANESAWIDALEQGAADYLSVPCEPRQVHWILEAHTAKPESKRHPLAAASAAR